MITWQTALNLTDDESKELASALRDVLASFSQKPPQTNRRRRLLTTILLPTMEPTPEEKTT